MEAHLERIEALRRRGVVIPNPYGVEIGPEVRAERISRNVTLHSGTKLFGAETFVGEGAVIGHETPATIQNGYVGTNVRLNGGFYSRAVFLNGAKCGSGAHVREGTIIEEHASIAHTVGLKQTILFPYVTLGSLINFCDCLMAGGTGPKDHSEVGSSYIHFNFTPNQDKATPSMFGDVPRGVMLNQPPIFLGGQGGLVGPCRIAYGTVIAAGTVFRKDQLQPERLVFEGNARSGNVPFRPGGFRNLKRVLINNFIYVGNLLALEQWYRHVRPLFTGPYFPAEVLEGLHRILGSAISERVNQLDLLGGKIQQVAPEEGIQLQFVRRWPQLKDRIGEQWNAPSDGPEFERFMKCLHLKRQEQGADYIECIKKLSLQETAFGTGWLNGCVRRLLEGLDAEFPELKLLQVWGNG